MACDSSAGCAPPTIASRSRSPEIESDGAPFGVAIFGRRSERLDPDQLALALDDLDADIVRIRESRPDVAKPPLERASHRKPLPDHLPREEVRLDIGSEVCACCGGAMHSIGESQAEMLDWVPAQLRVIRITRPKYACRVCETVVQAPAPERLIAGGVATPALIAQVLVSKYCDHTPLYRQSQIFARHGIDLARSTLAGWVGAASWWLEALHQRLARNVFASDHLFADDRPVPVLDPGRGRTKIGRLWVYARDQRSWAGPEPPAAVYLFAPDRRAERPAAHLQHFSGVLHVDGYAGFEPLASRGNVVLAACWAHTWRKFYDVAQATGSPVATEALRRIGELYAVEAQIRGQSPAHRLAMRRQHSRPLVADLRAWLQAQLMQVSGRSPLTEAIRYAITRWEGLTRFLLDGRVELHTNPVERAIRPTAVALPPKERSNCERPAVAMLKSCGGTAVKLHGACSSVACRLRWTKTYSDADGLRKRTPAPSPFSGRNSIPAASRAACSAVTVEERSCSPRSKRTIVCVDTEASRARSSTPHVNAARAILHCAGVILSP